MMTQFFSRLLKNAVLTKALCSATILAMLACASLPAHATTFNTSKSGIRTLGYVDWSQYGPPGTGIQSGSGFTATHGLTGSVAFQAPSSSGKAVVTKGVSGVGPLSADSAINGDEWDGNFADAETVLWANSPGQGPITLTFDSPVQAVGAQIQTDFFGGFMVEMDVFHQGALLASYDLQGDSNNLGDGSAMFAGVADDVAEIDMVRYTIVDCTNDCQDFAINALDIGVPAEAPEPGTLALLGSSVIGIGTVLRRRFIQ